MPSTYSREAELSCPHQTSDGGFRGRGIGEWLQCYFRFGWAFLIPYLAVYLLYAWLKWPVHPQGAWTWVPALLHVYWFLHGLHVILGGLALRAGWRQHSVPGSPLVILRPVLPWMLLGVLFFVPGIYWEFPGDSWEHYMRINDWSLCAVIRDNSGWLKSSYFLAYSFVGALPAARQIFWLDFYYTGMCLLVCWQYYLLAREIGLAREAALLFVLLQALLFGNSLFSYYRYYGLASTMPAHCCALALIRLGVRHCPSVRTGRLRASLTNSTLQGAGSMALLAALMIFNHPQALGLAFLGLIAVAVWQVGEWKRSALIWLAGGVVVASLAMIAWWPARPALHEIYRSTGWMTPWYGFGIFSPDSPAGQRGLQVLGAFGLLNLAAGVWLLRRNHPAGWLTVTPVLALLCPLFAIPFATMLLRSSPEYIVVFSRMLLGIPAGLALVVVFQQLAPRLAPAADRVPEALKIPSWPILPVCLAVLLVLPAGAPSHNRFWHAIARTPADLALHPVMADFSRPELARFRLPAAPHFVTTDGLGFAAHASGFNTVAFNDRLIGHPQLKTPAAGAEQRDRYLNGPLSREVMILAPAAGMLHSPASLAGHLSGHWFPQEVALAHATGPETATLGIRLGAKQNFGISGTYYLISR